MSAAGMRTFLVTRAREQASDLSERLRALGAIPVEFPTIGILPPESWTDADHCIPQLIRYDRITFTSVNGVRSFVDRLLALGRDVRDLKGPQVCAIGPRTAEALEALKVRVKFVPQEYRAEAIFEGLKKEKLRDKSILIPRAKVARDILPEELRKAGAVVDVVRAAAGSPLAAYGTVFGLEVAMLVIALLLSARVDVRTSRAGQEERENLPETPQDFA